MIKKLVMKKESKRRVYTIRDPYLVREQEIDAGSIFGKLIYMNLLQHAKDLSKCQ